MTARALQVDQIRDSIGSGYLVYDFEDEHAGIGILRRRAAPRGSADVGLSRSRHNDHERASHQGYEACTGMFKFNVVLF